MTCVHSGSLDDLEPDPVLHRAQDLHPHVPASAFFDLGGMAGGLALKTDTEVTENPSLFFVQGSQVTCFLPDKAHVIPSLLLFATYV